jgi:hypothetical protein
MPEIPETPEVSALADVAEAATFAPGGEIAASEEVGGDAPTSQNRDMGHPTVEAAEVAVSEDAETHANEDETKEETPMLDVHPAHHAASSWKEFFIHIATIVLGLLIAVGLEQGVEWVHHRREVAAVREELRAEREYNIDHFKSETAVWRWETVMLENNLMVLAYLKQHPGTADEKLPGSLVWYRGSRTFSEAAWDAAKSSGVTSLMPREEVAGYAYTYRQLKWISDADDTTWDAMNDAERYQLTDSRLSHLSAAQIGEITTLTQIALTKRRGV